MLRLLSTGWGSTSSSTSIQAAAGPSQPFKAPSSRVQSTNSSNNGQSSSHNKDDDGEDNDVPSFPMIGSIQRAASSRQPAAVDIPAFDVSPPSPGASEDEDDDEDSSPPTPKVRPRGSHRPFAPESDDILNGLALPPSTNAVPPKVRRKEALKPGHSPLDWARVCREGGDELRVSTQASLGEV